MKSRDSGPYSRKSFDKGMTLNRSAIHAKTSGLMPKGPIASMYDINGL